MADNLFTACATGNVEMCQMLVDKGANVNHRSNDTVKIPQDGNRANTYGHVAVVHEHVWRTLCSVCATGARVARFPFFFYGAT